MKLEKLGNIARIQIGKTPPRGISKYWGNGNSWVSISDLKSSTISSTKEEITDLAVSECGCKMIPKGTLLMSFKLSIGKVAFAGKDLFTNEAICGIILKDKSKVVSEYLYYALKNTKLVGSNVAVKGATLNTASLNALQIPFIEGIENQLHIANLLTKAENLIAQRKESIRLLDEFLKSTFLEMFGDPVRNEKGISKSKLCTLTKIGTGGTPSRRREVEFYNGKIPWVKTTEVNGSYIFNTEEKITEAALKESNCRLYPVGTILLAMYGQGKTRGNVGVLKIEATTNQACAAVLPSDNFNTIFLFQQLKQLYASIRNMAKGSNQENLNLSIVGNIEVLIPPIELQTQFARIVEKTEALKTQYQQSLQELEHLYGSLSQKAFRGELGIKQESVQ
jgi:type I restriction enzyme, S subunit